MVVRCGTHSGEFLGKLFARVVHARDISIRREIGMDLCADLPESYSACLCRRSVELHDPEFRVRGPPKGRRDIWRSDGRVESSIAQMHIAIRTCVLSNN